MAITVAQLITAINTLADESEAPEVVIEFINDGIARINTYMSCGLPFLSPIGNTPMPLPDKWMRTLLIPFAVGRIKQMDSSQFEYTDAYSDFLNELDELKQKYKIPRQYLDLMPDQQVNVPGNPPHTTVSGDTFYSIAEQYNVDLQELMDLNTHIQFEDSSNFHSDIFTTPPNPYTTWGW